MAKSPTKPETAQEAAGEVLTPLDRKVIEPTPVAAPALRTPTQHETVLRLVERMAADPTVDLDRVERMLQMATNLAEQQAERSFTEAMAEFKQDPPRIVKDKKVSFQTNRGATEYMQATLGDVCEAAIRGLARVGISHRWVINQKEGMVQVICILTHRAGHSQSTFMEAPPDDSGNKNKIQSIASTVTYLERYTLLAATGLATEDQDDDAQASGARVGDRKEEETEPRPEGFDNWTADMEAIDSTEDLRRSWENSNPVFRRYVVKHMPGWWENRKVECARRAQS